MRKRILTIIAGVMYYSGLVALARWWTRCAGKQLVILNYHRATGGDLLRHLVYLRKHYRIMHIEAALEELYTPRKKRDRRADKRTPLVLTFDDGYRDNYTHAFKLARELQIPMSLYLVPGYIESGAHFWWNEDRHLLQHAQVREVQVEGRVYHLDSTQERAALALLITTRVYGASSVAEREAFLTTMRETLAVPFLVAPEDEPALPLTWQQIQEMTQSGWISFGAHTMHHPILGYLKDSEEVRCEIETCRSVLEQQLGHPVRSFAYPVGKRQHIGQSVRQAVKLAGYAWAVTTNYGFNTPRTDPYMLRRVEVDVDQHWYVMAAETAGLWGFFSRLRWLPVVRNYLLRSR